MVFIRKPSGEQIKAILQEQAEQPFSYEHQEATRGAVPEGYAVDHWRTELGRGEHIYQRARMALLRWRMFELSWVQLCWPTTAVQAGNTVGILAHTTGGWWLNACRIVYTLEEQGPVERLTFAYGTLPEHVALGEERFSVEWHHADDSVWYETLAYSRPNHRLARLANSVARRNQQRFGADSREAMARAVGVKK